MGLDREINQSEHGRLHAFVSRMRARLHRHPVLLFIHRFVVITLGFLCLVAGLIMLVTPGPGWLFIFMGLGLWGTEFTWAHRFNVWAKAKVLGVWYAFEARRDRRRRDKLRARWKGRKRGNHYCQDQSHYH